jgi:Fe-S cluster assembly protein SufB
MTDSEAIQVQEIDKSRDRFDHKNEENAKFRADFGVTKEIVEMISKDKDEPEWMLKHRLKCLELFHKLPMPKWGPSIDKLDLNEISFYLKPNAKKNANKWEDVPDDIKKTFEKLGIPEAERTALGGVGAQYESEIVYHSLKKELADKGVIFEDCDYALKHYPELMKKYFMKCVPPSLHKFAALHGAVWSGGTFLYVPRGVKVDLPLQAYFRMNAEKLGQFEHTLIVVEEGAEVHYIEGCSAPRYDENSLHAGCVEVFVHKNARARYSSIENWSRNTFNLNTKRANVYGNAYMEWVNGNMGSNITMLYPCSVLMEEGAKTDYLGVAFAGKGQNQDTGCKIYHLAKNTHSTIKAKSISKDGGITTYRGLLQVAKGAVGSKANVLCDALMMDNISKSDTVPTTQINESEVDIGHEATVGKIDPEQIFYLTSRGIPEDQATQMVVAGFIEPIVKELPLEYAVELNRLIQLEMEGSIG